MIELVPILLSLKHKQNNRISSVVGECIMMKNELKKMTYNVTYNVKMIATTK